jgi:hypothetical protein
MRRAEGLVNVCDDHRSASLPSWTIRNFAGHSYLAGMAKAFEFAIPTPRKAVPDRPQWINSRPGTTVIATIAFSPFLLRPGPARPPPRFPALRSSSINSPTRQVARNLISVVVSGEALMLQQ